MIKNGRSLDIGYRLQPSWGGCLVAARACAAHLFTEQAGASAQIEISVYGTHTWRSRLQYGVLFQK